MKQAENSQTSFLQKVGNFFLTTVIGGLIVILPISIFIILLQFAIKLVLSIVAPLSYVLRFGDTNPKWMADLMAFVIIMLLFFIIGLVVQMRWGNTLFRFFERKYLSKIPFYITIRDTVQQFTGKSKSPFSQVVMADVFGNDTRMLGFVTDELEHDMFSIFVPTGPNPTNGFVFHVKGHQLEFINVRSEDAMRSIIAVGAGTRTMLDKLKNAKGGGD